MRAGAVLVVGGGLALVLAGALPLAWGELQRREDIAAFGRPMRTVALVLPQSGHRLPDRSPHVSRVAPAALLRIPRIDLEVPVNIGTGEAVLLRGAGLIDGTALPGSDGNVGIAAHRDTHFRRLGELAVGDLIHLDTTGSARSYRVAATSIVAPEDVAVLAASVEPTITLVTCYPFRFVGAAPQRFIVRAVAESPPQ